MVQGANTAHFQRSSFREAVLEHLFVGELLKVLWQRGVVDAEILRPQVDNAGYDLAVEANSVLRHVQLKTSFREAKTSRQKVHRQLAKKESGCVIWVEFDQRDLSLGPYRWFGAAPGCRLPDLSGFKVARHTKGDAQGHKAERPDHCVVPKGHFSTLDNIGEVADALFWGAERRRKAFRRAAGVWNDRSDLPEFESLRASWDRA